MCEFIIKYQATKLGTNRLYQAKIECKFPGVMDLQLVAHDTLKLLKASHGNNFVGILFHHAKL